MNQIDKLSPIKAATNFAIDGVIAIATQLVLLPVMGMSVPLAHYADFGTRLGAVSVLRAIVSYRLLAWLTDRLAGGGSHSLEKSMRKPVGPLSVHMAIIRTGGRTDERQGEIEDGTARTEVETHEAESVVGHGAKAPSEQA